MALPFIYVFPFPSFYGNLQKCTLNVFRKPLLHLSTALHSYHLPLKMTAQCLQHYLMMSCIWSIKREGHLYLYIFIFLVSVTEYRVTPPTTYDPSPSSFTNDCNLGDFGVLRRCPDSTRLTDGKTNEGMDFDPDNFMGWNKSFDLEFIFGSPNYYITRVDIYYYNNPSQGYGLPDIRTSTSPTGQRFSFNNVVSTFIDNSEVSQSDDEVQMLSLIILTPFSVFGLSQQAFHLQFIFSSSYLATQTFISEMKFFNYVSGKILYRA